MLVLTRKRDGEIRIGEHIVIKVIQTGKSSIKIGIEAPADMRIVRGELPRFDEPAAATQVSVPAVAAANKVVAESGLEQGFSGLDSNELLAADDDLEQDEEFDIHEVFTLDSDYLELCTTDAILLQH